MREQFIPLEHLLATGRPDAHPVAFREVEVLDFRALRGRTEAWADALLPYRDRSFSLWVEDAFEFAAVLLGGWQAGAIAVLPTDTRPATLERLREEVDAWVGAAPPDAAPLVACGGCPAPSAGGGFRALDPRAPAVTLFTSGSSGLPVRLPKRLEQLSHEVRTLASTWDGLLQDRPVRSTVSHQHIYGLLHRVLWPLASGRPFDARRLTYPEDIRDALTARPGVLVSSPAHLKRLPSSFDWARARAHLTALFSSGGPLPEEAVRDCRILLGQVPFEVYGSSETGGIAWRQRSTDDAAPWSVFEDVEVRIEEGVLWVRSPLLASDDWMATSDRAELRPSGLVLLGRTDRLLKVEEKRISLTAVERALCAGGLLEEARVVPLQGKRLALGAVCVVSQAGQALLRTDGKAALNQALRHSARTSVEALALPRRFRYVSSLPVNGQGKTTEAMLVALFDPRRAPAQLLEQDTRRVRLQLEVRADCPFFEGHFPGEPILPGVTQLEWAIRLGREHFPIPPAFTGLEALKFQRIIQPDTSLDLTLEWAPEQARLTFSLSSEAGVHASGRVLFGEAGS